MIEILNHKSAVMISITEVRIIKMLKLKGASVLGIAV